MQRCMHGRVLTRADTFYIVDSEPALEGVDVATNATTAVTNFTRYTVAPTTVFSQSTRITGSVTPRASLWMHLADERISQTAKSRHKASKRRAAGRKGTVDEYEYLLASIGRLIARLDEKSGESRVCRNRPITTARCRRPISRHKLIRRSSRSPQPDASPPARISRPPRPRKGPASANHGVPVQAGRERRRGVARTRCDPG